MGKNNQKIVSTKIPIEFQAVEQLDSRFMKIKVWILNIGKNYNGSIFTKEAVLKALPSIALTPILGYIEESEDGKDFSDHRIVLSVDDDKGISTKYLGSAYGVIPNDPNPRFELRANEFGGLEEYLTVEGLLWTKFDEAIDIMNRDSIKFQSMELSEKYDGYFNEDGYFVFTEFQFFGCCILGSGNEPAIPQSTVEKMFSQQELTSIINSKLAEYKNKFEKKEDNEVHKKLMQDFGISAEQLKEAGITDIEKYDIEEFKEELRKILEQANDEVDKEKQDAKDNQNDEQNQDRQDDNQNPSNQENQEFDKDGENDDVDNKDKSTNEASKKDAKQENDESDSKKDKEFSENGKEENELDQIKTDMAQMKMDYEKLKEEHDKLVEYKQNKEEEEHLRSINAKIAEFEALSDEDVKEIRENAKNYSIQDAEDKLFAILGRKQSGKPTEDKFAKFYVKQEKETAQEVPSSYDHYFTKHLKK